MHLHHTVIMRRMIAAISILGSLSAIIFAVCSSSDRTQFVPFEGPARGSQLDTARLRTKVRCSGGSSSLNYSHSELNGESRRFHRKQLGNGPGGFCVVATFLARH